MSNSPENDICVRSARECVRLAQMTNDPELRHQLFEVARDWIAAATSGEQQYSIEIEEAYW